MAQSASSLARGALTLARLARHFSLGVVNCRLLALGAARALVSCRLAAPGVCGGRFELPRPLSRPQHSVAYFADRLWHLTFYIRRSDRGRVRSVNLCSGGGVHEDGRGVDICVLRAHVGDTLFCDGGGLATVRRNVVFVVLLLLVALLRTLYRALDAKEVKGQHGADGSQGCECSVACQVVLHEPRCPHALVAVPLGGLEKTPRVVHQVGLKDVQRRDRRTPLRAPGREVAKLCGRVGEVGSSFCNVK